MLFLNGLNKNKDDKCCHNSICKRKRKQFLPPKCHGLVKTEFRDSPAQLDLKPAEKDDEDCDLLYMMPKYMSLDVLLAVGKRNMLKLSGQMAEANALRNDLNRLGASLTEQVFMDAAFNAYVEAFNKCLIWGVFNPDDALASIDYYERNIVGDPKTAYLLVKNPEDGANGLIDVLVADYEESEGQIKSPPDRLLSDPWLAEALQR